MALGEVDGLGIDREGRPYWNGKLLEFRQQLKLTKIQSWFASIVALATLFGMVATCLQGWTAYSDWACKFDRHVLVSCPPPAPQPASAAHHPE
jgi:hypothetical protein